MPFEGHEASTDLYNICIRNAVLATPDLPAGCWHLGVVHVTKVTSGRPGGIICLNPVRHAVAKPGSTYPTSIVHYQHDLLIDVERVANLPPGVAIPRPNPLFTVSQPDDLLAKLNEERQRLGKGVITANALSRSVSALHWIASETAMRYGTREAVKSFS